MLQRYTDLRVQESSISLDIQADRAALLSDANRLLDDLWACARRTAVEAPNPVTSGLFIQLKTMIDAAQASETQAPSPPDTSPHPP